MGTFQYATKWPIGHPTPIPLTVRPSSLYHLSHLHIGIFAMIRFACPKCGTTYTVREEDAGKKSDCKSCGQRLAVPTPPQPARRKTTLGTLIPDESPTPPPAEATFSQEHVPGWYTPRQAAARGRTRVWLQIGIVCGIGLMIATCVGFLILLATPNTVASRLVTDLGKPSPNKQGTEWNLKELLAFLDSQGLIWAIDVDLSNYKSRKGPQCFAVSGIEGNGGYIYHFRTPQMARDASVELDTWNWGRFLFEGFKPNVLNRIKAALGG